MTLDLAAIHGSAWPCVLLVICGLLPTAIGAVRVVAGIETPIIRQAILESLQERN